MAAGGRSARAATGHETSKQRGELRALGRREPVERLLDGGAAFAAALVDGGSAIVGEGDDAAAGIRRVNRSRDEAAVDAIRDDTTGARLIDADRGSEFAHARTIAKAVER